MVFVVLLINEINFLTIFLPRLSEIETPTGRQLREQKKNTLKNTNNFLLMKMFLCTDYGLWLLEH